MALPSLFGRLLALCASGFIATAHAVPPPVRTQVPGYYRLLVGALEVTALLDGNGSIGTASYQGMSQDELRTEFAKHFLPTDIEAPTSRNAFLVHTGIHLVLVDTGRSADDSRLLANIRAAGYAPEDIDVVLLTHLHPDHVLGLIGRDGTRNFSKASVWVAKAETAHWLDPQKAHEAAEDAKSMFAAAQKGLAPYRAAGAVREFEPGASILPEVTIMAAPGHTPGHCAFLFQSQGRGILLWGDIVHNAAVQFAHPVVTIEYDTDPVTAIKTRNKLLEESARHGWLIGGAHLPFPGIGHVGRAAGAYSYVPVPFTP